MAQAIVHRGSGVLIRYPFTDLTGAKVRPALVLRVLGEGEPSLMHEVNQRLRLALGV